MISIEIESVYTEEAKQILDSSLLHLHNLYEEEKNYTYNSDQLTFFMIRENNFPIGCGAFSWIYPKAVEIKHIYLLETARGKGLGRRLMAYIENVARDKGAEIYLLETTLKQSEAIHLYTRMGYEKIEPYKNLIHGEQVFMTKRIK